MKDSKNNIEQATILRVFQTINHLKRNGASSLQELSDAVGVHERTMRRYLKLIDEIGISVDQKPHTKKYFICYDELSIDDRRFNTEELQIIENCLQALPSSGSNDVMLDKLKSMKNRELGQHSIAPLLNLKKHQTLLEAINNKAQVVLVNYHSSNSNTIQNRIVEPYNFSNDRKSIHAFDLTEKMSKKFKIDRMESVQTTEVLWQQPSLHINFKEDVFGMSDETFKDEITLWLSERARNLLIEEFGTANADITSQNNEKFPYVFSSTIYNHNGAGRFVLGLPQEVKVQGSAAFIQYLKDKQKQANWL